MKKLLLLSLVCLSIIGLQAVEPPLPQTVYQERNIHPRDLPQKVRKYIIANYNGSQIKKVKAIDNGAETKYQVHIHFRGRALVLVFNKSGDFEKKE